MPSIYIYSLKGKKCVEVKSPLLEEEEILKLEKFLPASLKGLSFEDPRPLFKQAGQECEEYREESDPRSVAEYLVGIGVKLESLKLYYGALRFFDLALKHRSSSEVIMRKAHVLELLGYADKSERLLNQYQQKNPKAPEPYFILGKQALGRTDYARAEQCFKQALERLNSKKERHEGLKKNINLYLKFVGLFLERDRLFTRNLSHEECMDEIRRLIQDTYDLEEEVEKRGQTEKLEGMIFFLKNQRTIFNKWLEEMDV
ncbi:MAG: hypothetical protein KDK66_02565 [Deltaproteobacteria bacterium]|nr:hypothetical protein [Deltaproteobacteria bacterium]